MTEPNPAAPKAELIPVPKDIAVIPPPAPRTPKTIKDDPYAGMSLAAFSTEIVAVLNGPIDANDIEILPTTGALYYPEIKYRRVLARAFGPGGWALVRTSDWNEESGTLSAEFRLYAQGRFIAEARGEQDYIPNNPNTSHATATEGAKSNALMRCCKDLGIASECWDPNFVESWKRERAVRVWVEGKTAPQWRRKDRTPFYKESGPADQAPTPRPSPQRASAPPTPTPQKPTPASPVAPQGAQTVFEALVMVLKMEESEGTYKSGLKKGQKYTKYRAVVKNPTDIAFAVDTFDKKDKDKLLSLQGTQKLCLVRYTMNGIFRNLVEVVMPEAEEPLVMPDDEPSQPVPDGPPVCSECGTAHSPDCKNGGEPLF